MKFLLISAERFPPFRVDVTVLFGKEFVKRGHQIIALMQSEKECRRSWQTEWAGCQVYVGASDGGSSLWCRLKKRSYDFFNDLRLFGLSRRYHFDFLLVRDKFLIALFAILAAKIHRTKFFFWLSYPFPEADIVEASDGSARYPFLYRLKGNFTGFLLYRIIIPSAAHVFVQSAQMKLDIMAHGVVAAKMTPVPMGVDLSSVPFYEDDLVRESGRPKKIVYLGTLKEIRKLDFMVRVLALVVEEVSDCMLYFVGSGEIAKDEELLLKEAARLQVEDKLTITGFLPMQQAWEYVKEADVCVSPFFPTFVLNSTSPTKLIEYMAMGKAVVANDHPEQKQVIEESGAGICTPYSEKEFAAAIVKLLNNPQETRKMGKKGRLYVERHRDYPAIADQVEKKMFSLL